jgi:hypothetical protein
MLAGNAAALSGHLADLPGEPQVGDGQALDEPAVTDVEQVAAGLAELLAAGAAGPTWEERQWPAR